MNKKVRVCTRNLPKVVKAYSQITTKPLLKGRLAFFSSERDLSQNINKAIYKQVKMCIVCKIG